MVPLPSEHLYSRILWSGVAPCARSILLHSPVTGHRAPAQVSSPDEPAPISLGVRRASCASSDQYVGATASLVHAYGPRRLDT